MKKTYLLRRLMPRRCREPSRCRSRILIDPRLAMMRGHHSEV